MVFMERRTWSSWSIWNGLPDQVFSKLRPEGRGVMEKEEEHFMRASSLSGACEVEESWACSRYSQSSEELRKEPAKPQE